VTDQPGADHRVEDLRGLVERIAAGDPAADAELAHRFDQRIQVMMTVRTRDRETARDLAQESMIAALGALRKNQLREPERLAGFVYGIARNVLNNYFRRRRAQPPAVELTEESASFLPEDDLESGERERALRQGLGQLEADDRAILVMTLVDDLKPGEIARRLGLSSEVVRTRKSRALKRLTEHVRRVLGMKAVGRVRS
jgi:RNA polymerase sigma-70 factor (ECF subfamily)